VRRRALVAVVTLGLAAAAASGLLLLRPDPLARAMGSRRPTPEGGARAAAPGVDSIIRIPLTDRLPGRLPADGVPAGWHLKEFAGRADVELVQDETLALRLRSQGASYVLYRDLAIDVRSHPWLSWSWKVMRLPPGGDVRTPEADDQAAQVYVVFPRWPAPQERSHVIGYVWDTTAPVGTELPSSRASNVRLVVVASGLADRGLWRHFQRNVAADYAALFGREPPRAGKIGVMIDSNDTGSEAEAFVADLRFSSAPGEKSERPTSMLR
jgi:hypothetical protein